MRPEPLLLLMLALSFGLGCKNLVENVPPSGEATVLATGSEIAGANGLHVSPDGRLFVATVNGSELVVLDPDSGSVLERLSEGIDGPDDVAFNASGDYYWTSILTGEVAGRTASGERISAASLTPGVNPLTFSPDGRLFVSQCFFDDKLYEIDPKGVEPPRLISDQLGPGCGLNGMDWGPDGRLYGPRWFRQNVVSFDVDTGEMRVEAEGFAVPAAVKFDGNGTLHVLDTMEGTVVRVDGDTRNVVAKLPPGLDNLAFDASDRLFVSSFVDGAVWRIEDGGTPIELLPGGMSHPGAIVAVPKDDGLELLVADLHSVRGFDAETGASTFVERNILGVSEIGSVLSLSRDGDLLILVSFTDNAVRIWDPIAKRNVARFDHLAMPVSAVRYGDLLVVAEDQSGSVRVLDGGPKFALAVGLPAPTDLLTDGERLWVSDRELGQVLRIAEGGRAIPPIVEAEGLEAPEGLAFWGDRLLVREGESGRVFEIGRGRTPRLVARLGTGSPAAAPATPPSMALNDLVIVDDVLYATNEEAREVIRIDLAD